MMGMTYQSAGLWAAELADKLSNRGLAPNADEFEVIEATFEECIRAVEKEAEQRGAKRERTWMAELHRSYFARKLSLKKFLEAIHARGKQTEPA